MPHQPPAMRIDQTTVGQVKMTWDDGNSSRTRLLDPGEEFVGDPVNLSGCVSVYYTLRSDQPGEFSFEYLEDPDGDVVKSLPSVYAPPAFQEGASLPIPEWLRLRFKNTGPAKQALFRLNLWLCPHVLEPGTGQANRGVSGRNRAVVVRAVDHAEDATAPADSVARFPRLQVTPAADGNRLKVEATMPGVSAIKGDKGDPPNITVGSVTTLPAGQPATVQVTGTSPDYSLNFGIPQGAAGQDAAPEVMKSTAAIKVNTSSGVVSSALLHGMTCSRISVSRYRFFFAAAQPDTNYIAQTDLLNPFVSTGPPVWAEKTAETTTYVEVRVWSLGVAQSGNTVTLVRTPVDPHGLGLTVERKV